MLDILGEDPEALLLLHQVAEMPDGHGVVGAVDAAVVAEEVEDLPLAAVLAA